MLPNHLGHFGRRQLAQLPIDQRQQPPSSAEIAASDVGYLPQNYVKVEGREAQQVLRLMEELEDHDDVQNVSSNFDISEEEIAAFSQAG